MLWIGSVLCEKIRHVIVARTFALIAPVWRVLHQVSCSSKTVQNAPKRKESHQNMSLGSNGVDRVFVNKNLTRHRGTNFCINCSSKTVHNAPKRKESHQNMNLGSNGVDRECSLTKIITRHRGTNFCINCTNLARFEASFVQLRNGSKCTQMKKNTPKHEFRVQFC